MTTGTNAKHMTPTGYQLFERNGLVVLRCLSPDAMGGFFNLDRRECTNLNIDDLRRTGRALAERCGVTFIDKLPMVVVAPTARKSPRTRVRTGLSNSAIRRRALAQGYAAQKSKKRTASDDDMLGWRVVEVANGNVVLGARYDATLTDIHHFLSSDPSASHHVDAQLCGRSETAGALGLGLSRS
jgi:hypothetical protein